MAMGITDLKPGVKILLDGVPYEVLKGEHLKVAMGKGVEKTTLKNLLTGSTIPRTFRDFDVVEPADITYQTCEFLYSSGDEFNFMNVADYEQFVLPAEAVGDNKFFMGDGDKVVVMFFNGNPINISLEPSITLTVKETPPGEKGNSVQGGKKPATLNTGLVVQVPLFIKVGDKLRVDTRTHEYLSRVSE